MPQPESMEVLREFFITNRIVVVFGYGLVYFLLGFGLTLYSRRTSTLTVARALPLLGTFGILHGIAEWGNVFIPIQASYVSPATIAVLWGLQGALLALAFAFLLQFGLRLLSEALPGQYRRLPAWAWVLFGLWLVVYALTGWRFRDTMVVSWLDAGEVWSRYLLALPGALVAGYALRLQTDEIRRLGVPRLLRVLRLSVLSFGLFAFVGGVIVPKSYMFLARHLNTDAVFLATGVPVEMWRGLVGLAIALSVIRMLEIFDVEEARRLEAAHRVETVLNERDRIARELHDGIIQYLYAVGLHLEAAWDHLEDDPSETRSRIQYVMQRLDESIRDIRHYIANLRSPIEDERSLQETLALIAAEFKEGFGVAVTLEASGEAATQLRPDVLNHLRQIARESLTNAVRHGDAKRISMKVIATADEVQLVVSDYGSGFVPRDGLARGGNGLRNMEQRVQLMDGTFGIESVPGRGTTVTVVVPRADVTPG